MRSAADCRQSSQQQAQARARAQAQAQAQERQLPARRHSPQQLSQQYRLPARLSPPAPARARPHPHPRQARSRPTWGSCRTPSSPASSATASQSISPSGPKGRKSTPTSTGAAPSGGRSTSGPSTHHQGVSSHTSCWCVLGMIVSKRGRARSKAWAGK